MGKKVGYCRLSRDEDKKNYSSIDEQIQIINDYANSIGDTIDEFYIDDNVSGYIFNRPEFNKMLDELYSGNISVIYAKDLSRIGRKNGRVLTLIDDIKEMGKNLILIKELGGTLNLKENFNDCIGITTWYNERLVRDVSNKVKASLHSKQKNGTSIINGVYGYYKNPINRKELLVDEYSKNVVKLIFDLYTEKMFGFQKIANILNSLGYNTPSERRNKIYPSIGRTYKNNISQKWRASTIRRIITDDFYIGNLRTHKTEKYTIHGKSKLLNKDENYVFTNHHPPIIDMSQFEKAQNILKSKELSKTLYSNTNIRNYIFRGLLKCGNCGETMTGITKTRKNNITNKCYICNNARQRSFCNSYNYIKEDYILKYFYELLYQLKIKYNDVISNINIKNKPNYFDDISQKLDTKKKEYDTLIEQKIKLLSTLPDSEKNLAEKSYQKIETKLLDEIKILEICKKNSTNQIINMSDFLSNIIQSENLNSKTISQILDKAYISKNSIEFILKINISKLLN